MRRRLSPSVTLLTECTAASMHTVQCPEAYRAQGEEWRLRLSRIAEEDLACLESELEFAELLLERRAAIGRCSDRVLWAGVLDGNPG